MHSLTHNLITARWFGCVIAENFFIKSTGYIEKFLRIIYNDETSSYEELLPEDNSVSMHHKNLQKRVTKTYKVAKGLCPKIMNEFFQFQIQNHRNLRNNSYFRIHHLIQSSKGKKVYPLPRDMEPSNRWNKIKKVWM